ncbi:hypothetical protein GR211_16710 [Rhizobium leguminosarum]|uniref:hypothetical protein n=1 Tax=Rhizobium ruizarguesonis TaxID=2081791 RepID=UPI0013BCD025|nr:hypothetical protein [Rhizobium ruizarguesonis]NEJ14177.1 hypothetical protein [Rhizobium ruizarguesonis]NEK28549.1 hypothetical protein [Rhizobium ruizarguesonis]
MKNGTLERSLLVLACALTGVWFGYSLPGAEFPWEPIVTGVCIFSTWLGLDMASVGTLQSRDELHPHDKTLGQSLRAKFDPMTLRFLKEESFGQPFKNELLENLETLADDWQGANHEFENAELDNISSEIVKFTNEFCNKVAEYAGVAERRPAGYLAVPLQQELAADEFSEKTWAHIRELRALSSSLVVEYENFEKAFRRMAPEEYRSTS